MKYEIDGTIVDTDAAASEWEQRFDFDGRNKIGRSTRSQWGNERLYRSAKGRYYAVHNTGRSGDLPTAYWLTNEEAARWLVLNDHRVPADLRSPAAAIEE